ncbi:DUF4124 domain-containing protein [Acidovorax sp. SUPP1855]|uniref:DUF4124 domain-containing protein n=1 Tax=Acidovorax sp. SUPP1855 TaxID=431774 RepID=UPI0024E0C57E|nr:DUF4124 domain-containing protein [Acidovorax sp. SUPP1855]
MNTKGLAMVTMVLCGWTLSSTAQVHRCADATGKLTYSDQPCQAGQAGAQIEQRKTAEVLQQERAEAARAHQLKAQQQRAEQGAQRRPTPTTSPAPTVMAQTQPTAECRAAQKELEFVSSIRTLSGAEKRSRMNAAISGVNASCGTQTPLIQEPPPPVIRQIVMTHCDTKFCYDDRGAAYGRSGNGVLTAPDGQTCTGAGMAWTCQ